MRVLFVLWERELKATFHSFGVYFLLAVVTAITAFLLKNSLGASGGEMDFALRGLQGWLFWLTVVLSPLLTMRLLAEERRSGSLELLMTAPVGDGTVVLAKYLAAVVVYLIFLMPLWALHLILRIGFEAPVDWGQLAATTIGLSSLALVFLAVGLFASALSGMQLWAALGALLGNVILLSLGGMQGLFPLASPLRRFFAYIDLQRHLQTALEGVLDLRFLFMHFSLVGLLLFWTARTVESRKWR